MDKDGYTYFDKDKIALEAGFAKAQPNSRCESGRENFIRGDREALHGNVTRLLDQIRSSGFTKLSFEIKSQAAAGIPGRKVDTYARTTPLSSRRRGGKYGRPSPAPPDPFRGCRALPPFIRRSRLRGLVAIFRRHVEISLEQQPEPPQPTPPPEEEPPPPPPPKQSRSNGLNLWRKNQLHRPDLPPTSRRRSRSQSRRSLGPEPSGQSG